MASKALNKFRESIGLPVDEPPQPDASAVDAAASPASSSNEPAEPPRPIEEVAAERQQSAAAAASSQPEPAAPASPVATDQSTPSQDAAPPPNPFISELQAMGFADVADEEAGRRALLDAYRQQQEERQLLQRRYREFEGLAAYGQQYLAIHNDPAFREFLQSRGGSAAAPGNAQPVQQGAASPENKSWFNAPSLDSDLVSRYRVKTEAGEESWAPNTPAEIRSAAEAAEAQRVAFLTKFARQPDEALRPLQEQLAMQARDIAQEVFEQKAREQQQQELANHIATTHADWFAVDPLTQQRTYSEVGQYASQLWAHAANNLNIRDDAEAYRYVLGQLALAQALGGPQHQQPTANPNTPPESPPQVQRQDPKARVAALNKPKSIPSRNGVTPPGETGRSLPASRLTPGQRVLAGLEAIGRV